MVGRTPDDGARLEACVRAARAKRISVSQEHHASIFGGKIGEFKAACVVVSPRACTDMVMLQVLMPAPELLSGPQWR
jgi:hypothetical protein